MDEAGAWMAKSAVAELITRSAALNDAGNWDAVAALYMDDGRMNRPTAPDDFIVGHARPRRATRHIVANVLVTLDDDSRARASSQILLFTGIAEGDGPPLQSATPPLIGTYHGRLVRTDRGWRFAERRGSLGFRAPQ